MQENRLAPFFAYLLIGVPLFAPKLIAVLPTGAIDGILVFVGVAGLFECQLWTRIKLLFREPSQFGSAPFARGVRPWRMHLYEEENGKKRDGGEERWGIREMGRKEMGRREMGRKEMLRKEMGPKGDERIHWPVYWPDHTLRLLLQTWNNTIQPMVLEYSIPRSHRCPCLDRPSLSLPLIVTRTHF